MAVLERDWKREAQILFPWLPKDLLDVFAEFWAHNDDVGYALARMRESPSYERHFPGNRRPDGSFRYSEQDYMSTIDGYRITMAQRGVDPRVLEQRGWWEKLIEGDVSVREFDERIQSHWELNQESAEQAADWYRQNYGLDTSPEAMLLSFVDPEIGAAVVQRRLTKAQIGGAASVFGFSRDRGRVDQLARMGLDPAQARDFYGMADRALPGVAARAERFFDPQGQFGIGQFEEALVGGDATQQRRLDRGLQAEQSLFQQASPTRRDEETGGLRGLTQR